MTGPGPTTPIETIFEIDAWDIRAAVLRAALELGVFRVLAPGPLPASAVAARLASDPEATRVLLDAVGSFGLLTVGSAGYGLAPEAAEYLDPASPHSIEAAYLSEFAARDRFTESIRTGRPARDIRDGEASGLWAAYAFADVPGPSTSLEMHRDRWRAVGVTADTVPGARILDVGCGSGRASLVVAVDDPRASVVAIDAPAVLEATAATAAVFGVTDRTRLVPGDVSVLDRLEGPFDVVLFGFVLHYFDPDELRPILRATRRLLAEDGRVVIVTPFATPGDLSTPDSILTAVWMRNVAPHGALHSVETYGELLAEAGFGPVRRIEDTPWLVAGTGTRSGTEGPTAAGSRS